MSIDTAYEVAAQIIDEVTPNLSDVLTEEESKIHLINRILFEVLGWEHHGVKCERQNENGFSDYEVRDGETKAWILEAKRIGRLPLKTASKSRGYYKISGPVLKSIDGSIEQVANYALPQGFPMAVLTDGVAWIIFLPWVPQHSYKDRQAVVFPSLQAVIEDFSEFYELLSKEGLRRDMFHVIFDRIHENRLLLSQVLSAPIEQIKNERVQKSSLAFELEKVLDGFFASLSGDDEQMLVECFVETKESRIADFSLEKITKNVLGNIASVEGDIGEGLKKVVDLAVERQSGETIFIVGPSGSGKSTFVRRFFAKTLEGETREKCVVVPINLLDATGDKDRILAWITERAIEQIESALFPSGSPKWPDLLGLYHIEYKRRAEGVDSLLYTSDKDEFKKKFAAYVDESVERDREGYLKRLLRDIVSNRKMLPIFVVDNTDEFPIDLKINIFQYFQALRRGAGHCLLLFPVTDRSAWTFSKTEIFNIYTSRSFFLPTPSPREVFRKRIDYLKGKLDAKEKAQRQTYFSDRGIGVSIGNLGAFAGVLENIFVEQDYPSRRVGELSNYNIRKALGLSRRVITSSVLRVDDLITSYLTGAMVAPNFEKFMTALICGDFKYFRPDDEPLIINIFQVDNSVRQSPLLQLRILVHLRILHLAAGSDAERYISVPSLGAYFGMLGVHEASLQRALERLFQAHLIEQYDLSINEYSDDLRFSITQSGLAHVEFAMSNSVYVGQMALTTRISNSETSAKISGIFNQKATSAAKKMELIRAEFCKFIVEEDNQLCRKITELEYEEQIELVDRLQGAWIGGQYSADASTSTPLVEKDVRGIVETFNRLKGFGFVEIPKLKEQVFIHISDLKQSGFDEIYDGDEIICDVSKGDRGLYVSSISELQSVESGSFAGYVVKIFKDRSYAFVHLPQLGVDAFMHFNSVAPFDPDELYEGLEVTVEITTDGDGKSQVRRIVAL